MSAHETFDLTSYIVDGLVLQVGNAQKLSQPFVLERLDPFPSLTQNCPSLTHVQGDGYEQRVVDLSLEAYATLAYHFLSGHRWYGFSDACSDICVVSAIQTNRI